jgi:hypothetical protein
MQNGNMSQMKNEDKKEGLYIPITPAELPMNVPLLVTELRIALSRNRVFEAAIGRLAPSRIPHNPPMASPDQKNQYRWRENNRSQLSPTSLPRDKADMQRADEL